MVTPSFITKINTIEITIKKAVKNISVTDKCLAGKYLILGFSVEFSVKKGMRKITTGIVFSIADVENKPPVVIKVYIITISHGINKTKEKNITLCLEDE